MARTVTVGVRGKVGSGDLEARMAMTDEGLTSIDLVARRVTSGVVGNLLALAAERVAETGMRVPTVTPRYCGGLNISYAGTEIVICRRAEALRRFPGLESGRFSSLASNTERRKRLSSP